MSKRSVQDLLEDLRLISEDGYRLVQSVRKLVTKTLKEVDEEVKYGGILFASDGIGFGGVFAYSAHVSVEFSQGALIVDPFGHLDGKGKRRRHVKLRSTDDIVGKDLADYVSLALQAARSVG